MKRLIYLTLIALICIVSYTFASVIYYDVEEYGLDMYLEYNESDFVNSSGGQFSELFNDNTLWKSETLPSTFTYLTPKTSTDGILNEYKFLVNVPGGSAETEYISSDNSNELSLHANTLIKLYSDLDVTKNITSERYFGYLDNFTKQLGENRSADVSFDSDINVEGILYANAMGTGLDVLNSATIGNHLDVLDNLDVGGELEVTGTTNLSGNTIVEGYINVYGNVVAYDSSGRYIRMNPGGGNQIIETSAGGFNIQPATGATRYTKSGVNSVMQIDDSSQASKIYFHSAGDSYIRGGSFEVAGTSNLSGDTLVEGELNVSERLNVNYGGSGNKIEFSSETGFGGTQDDLDIWAGSTGNDVIRFLKGSRTGAQIMNIWTGLQRVSVNTKSNVPDYTFTVGGTSNFTDDVLFEKNITFDDSDVGLNFYSGSNKMLEISRFGSGSPTLTTIKAPVRMYFYAGGNNMMFMTSTYTFWNRNQRVPDNIWIEFGTGQDARDYYNISDRIIDPDIVGSGSVWIGATGDDDIYFNNARGYGNITSENVFIPQYAFAHTNRTQPVLGANTWTNMTFNQEATKVIFGITHTFDDNTNHTFTINEDGVYNLEFDFDMIDFSASATIIDMAGRIIYENGTEIDGSAFETDITRVQVETELSHSSLARLRSGDVIIFQFVADDADVSVATHGTFGTHPDSATIIIEKVANIL